MNRKLELGLGRKINFYDEIFIASNCVGREEWQLYPRGECAVHNIYICVYYVENWVTIFVAVNVK